MLRISTTTLDEYNKYLNWHCWRCRGNGTVEKGDDEIICPACNGTGDYCSEQQLIDNLIKKPEPTRFMELGSAFHDILAEPMLAMDRGAAKYGNYNLLIAENGIEFPLDVIENARKHIDSQFPFEIKTTKIFNFPEDTVELVAKADQLVGRWIVENKSVWTRFDYNKYCDSIQWKCYLSLFDAERVCYNIFIMTENDGISARDIQSFHFSSYPEIENEITGILHDFICFLKLYKLVKYFERQTNENIKN